MNRPIKGGEVWECLHEQSYKKWGMLLGIGGNACLSDIKQHHAGMFVCFVS